MGNGEKVGFVISVVSGVGSSSLVIDGRGGGTRNFGIFNLGMRASIDPGINLREGELCNHSSLL